MNKNQRVFLRRAARSFVVNKTFLSANRTYLCEYLMRFEFSLVSQIFNFIDKNGEKSKLCDEGEKHDRKRPTVGGKQFRTRV